VCEDGSFFGATIEFKRTLKRQRDDAAAKGQLDRQRLFDGLLERLETDPGKVDTMPKLGTHDGEPLVVDLSNQPINTWDELWDALTGPCGLPSWFGRNLDAWWDTIQTGAVSDVLDAYPHLIVRVRSSTRTFFVSSNDGLALLETTNECDYATAEIVSTLNTPVIASG
jgi:RNAse (barnase) inhibitor barstar